MKIAYQGTIGSYSQLACQKVFPTAQYIGCETFEGAMSAVKNKEVQYAMIPVENSNAGRVADVHFLLPEMGLFIVDEFFLKVEHQLLGLRGANLTDIKYAHSHPQALSQSSKFLKKHKINPVARIDTATSCQDILEIGDKQNAAVASEIAGKTYGMDVLASNIQNDNNNTTRFLIMAKALETPKYEPEAKYISSLIFKAKNIPAALYKALGGFATNGINITKIESYLLNGKFVSAQFYLEVEAHVKDKNFKNALEELHFFSEELKILGTYKAHDYRYTLLC